MNSLRQLSDYFYHHFLHIGSESHFAHADVHFCTRDAPKSHRKMLNVIYPRAATCYQLTLWNLLLLFLLCHLLIRAIPVLFRKFQRLILHRSDKGGRFVVELKVPVIAEKGFVDTQSPMLRGLEMRTRSTPGYLSGILPGESSH